MSRLFFGNLKPGTLLFYRFELIQCLSAQDIGGIYLCRDRNLAGRTVVVKVLSRIGEQFRRLDLHRELGLSRVVHHPNILSGQEFFRDDEFVAYSMDFADAGTLGDRMEAGPLSVADAVPLLLQLVSGLSALHAAGVLHRDIKPENILLTSGGAVKIADFGIAMLHQEARSPGAADRISGTINYLAPEYLVQGVYDTRSEVYSVGVLAYELLTGRLPFKGDDIMETLRQRVRFDPIAPHKLVPEIPRLLSDAVLTAMSRLPECRFRSVNDLQSILMKINKNIAQISAQEAA